MLYCDEHFYEPSEADMVIDEYKHQLRESVKEQFKAEMEALRKENTELRDVKKNWERIKQEHDQAMRDLENKKLQAKQEAKWMKIKDAINGLQSTYFEVVANDHIYPPKCNRCNDDRKIEFYSPSGRKMTERCTCDNWYYGYSVKESQTVLIRFTDARDEQRLIFRVEHDNDDLTTLIREDLSDDLDFEKVNKYKPLFADKAKAEAYAAWITAKSKSEFEQK